ncbi:MAG: aminotransferase class V-fold PLP-dependent enzyme [Betaproteobacteria bacterium]
MNARAPSGVRSIEEAVAAMSAGPLEAEALARHVRPLFSRTLQSNATRIHLANHSLGRPLDETVDDVTEALVAWQSRMGDAWDAWRDELDAYRRRLAALMRAPSADCIVPKTSAGQGLRTILNSYDGVPRVVATRGEFDSLDIILRQYARRGRIALRLVEARDRDQFAARDMLAAIEGGVDLLVVSHVVFNTGQVLPDLPRIIAATRSGGGRVLLDVYHSLGAMPLDVATLDADFAVGGSYKYLRGGPGACFLYLHPRHLDGSLTTLDVGWFGKEDAFSYQRPDPPRWAKGGDAFMESTPPVLTWYQARAGQRLTLALGVDRLRAYSLSLQRRLIGLLAGHGIEAAGGDDAHGAFCVVEIHDRAGAADHDRATAASHGPDESAAVRCSKVLAVDGVVTDARGPWLRLCPDILTTDEELQHAAAIVAKTVASIA